MKKTYLVLFMIALFSVLVSAGSQLLLNRADKHVVVDIVDTVGDVAIVDKLTITHNIQESGQIAWQVTHPMNDIQSISTQIDIHTRIQNKAMTVYQPLMIRTLRAMLLMTDEFTNLEQHLASDLEYSDIYKDLAAQTKAGQTNNTRVNIKDYYPYYHFKTVAPEHMIDEIHLNRIINSRVKIKIIEDVFLNFKVEKSDDGVIKQIGFEVINDRQIESLYLVGIGDQRGYYFYPMGDSNVIRHLKDSNYIYFIPINKLRNGYYPNDKQDSYYAKAITKAVKLDDHITDHYALCIAANGKQLYFLVNKSGSTQLDIIDTDSRDVIQSIPLSGDCANIKHSAQPLIVCNDQTVVVKVDHARVMIYDITNKHRLKPRYGHPIAIASEYPISAVFNNGSYVSIVQSESNNDTLSDTVVTTIDQQGNGATLTYRYNLKALQSPSSVNQTLNKNIDIGIKELN